MTRRLTLPLLLLLLVVPALATAQKLVDEPTRREAWNAFQRGQQFMAAERFGSAVDEYTRAVSLDPLFTLAHYQLGQAQMDLRQYASAVKAFKDCIEASRGLFALAQTNRFEVERRRDDEINEARESLALLQRTGHTAQAARAQDHLRDLETQRTSMVGEFHPPAEVLLSLGSAYFRMGDLAQAEAEWTAATQVNPRLGEAYSNLAVVYMMKGRKADASGAVKAAEKSGFRVNPQLKKDINAMR